MKPSGEQVKCPVCKGTKISPHTGNRCGCCDGIGTISKESYAIKQSIKKDLTKKLLGLESDAKIIIDFLLEDDGRRSCGMCEREFGVHDPDASHGNCKRHTLASYEQMIRMYPQNQAKILPLMQKIKAQPDSSFPPDLAEHPEIVTALGKKDFATHDQETKAYMDQFHRARGEQPV